MRLFLAVSAAIAVTGCCGSSSSPSSSGSSPGAAPTSTRDEPEFGDDGWLYWSDNRGLGIDVCPKDAFERSSKAAAAKDRTGFGQAIADCTHVAAGTKAKNIGASWTGGREVRVLDGPAAGVAGWVNVEVLHKTPK